MLRFAFTVFLVADIIAVTCGPEHPCPDDQICDPDAPNPAQVAELPSCEDDIDPDVLHPTASVEVDGVWQLVYADELGTAICTVTER